MIPLLPPLLLSGCILLEFYYLLRQGTACTATKAAIATLIKVEKLMIILLAFLRMILMLETGNTHGFIAENLKNKVINSPPSGEPQLLIPRIHDPAV